MLVLVGANWCGPCQIVKRSMTESQKNMVKIVTQEKDAEFSDYYTIMQEKGIMGLPTLLRVTENREYVEHWTGVHDIQDILDQM